MLEIVLINIQMCAGLVPGSLCLPYVDESYICLLSTEGKLELCYSPPGTTSTTSERCVWEFSFLSFELFQPSNSC